MCIRDRVYPAFAGVLGGQKPILKVRSMTSCWGVCLSLIHIWVKAGVLALHPGAQMAPREQTAAVQRIPEGAHLCQHSVQPQPGAILHRGHLPRRGGAAEKYPVAGLNAAEAVLHAEHIPVSYTHLELPDKAAALAHFTAMSDKVYPAFAGVLGGQKPDVYKRQIPAS